MSVSDHSVNRFFRIKEDDTVPDNRLLRGLSILDEAFTKLHVAAWRDNPSISVTEEIQGLVEVLIANPAVTDRSVRIYVTAFDFRIDVMEWEEAYDWSEETYDSLRSEMVNVLVAVLSDNLEIRRFGKSLAILIFSRNNRVTYRLRVFSGLLISPFSVREVNSGLFASPYERLTA
ncbi:MAG: hypothetical protein JNM31_07515 [Flavobacteriales bacterium]|nr:hypothetical protein [Flavobacteriales bacterium]